jgi:hypothetical protein
VKQQHEQELLRPLFELMLTNYVELTSTVSFDLPGITAVYHQHYGDVTVAEKKKSHSQTSILQEKK